MIEIALTKGQKTIVDDCDEHFLSWKWRAQQNHHGFYAVRSECSKENEVACFLHHAILGRPLFGLQIDHINGNSLDNRRQNLRIVTNRQNCSNQKHHRGEKKKSSSYVGVSWSKNAGKWRAYISFDGTQRHLGYYLTQEDASKAYQNEYLKVSKVELVLR